MNLDWLGLVLAISAAVVWFSWPVRRPSGPAPLPGALGGAPWVDIDEWEAHVAHVESALVIFADCEQYDVDLWDAQMQGNA